MPKADVPSVEELREIGRRLCARIGVRPHGPIDSVVLRRVYDERAHKTPSRGVMLALRACADALAEYELPPEVHALRAALDTYESARPTDAAKSDLEAALRAAVPVLDEEAARRAQACDAVLTDEQRAAGLTAEIWPSPDSLRDFPRKMLELLRMEAYVVDWLHRIVRDLALIDAHRHARTEFVSPRIRMTKALHMDGYRPAEIAAIIHPFAKGTERTAARLAVAKRLKLRSDEVVIDFDRRAGPIDRESLARAVARFVFTGQSEGLRIHYTGPTHSLDSVVAAELPIEERLEPKKRARRKSPKK